VRGDITAVDKMLAQDKPHVEDEVPDSFTDESAFDLNLACSESRIWIEVFFENSAVYASSSFAFSAIKSLLIPVGIIMSEPVPMFFNRFTFNLGI
jgi:hypothetical protein